ncbi:hypothetical protein THAOC_19930 [Thalassiosira oceanica]|uniref:Uncharacterized protein n=1 Tax=Thalassiosira oceanica TaxID=159749 RepID=K0S3K4_THAOC|nr:hypothetical protein THAOC_19930 [Thalassiosira oceanica]|eukprot:EJK59805.1 hypothetical protein THAOC_19930 [Thalassiosira oceanica]
MNTMSTSLDLNYHRSNPIHLRFRRSSSLADPKSNAFMLPWTPSRSPSCLSTLPIPIGNGSPPGVSSRSQTTTRSCCHKAKPIG